MFIGGEAKNVFVIRFCNAADCARQTFLTLFFLSLSLSFLHCLLAMPFNAGTDYFENLCLKPGQACKNTRVYQTPRIGVSDEKVAQYAGLHYYTDKELQVTSEPACRLACEIETEFLCRSFLYLGQPQGSQYNCRLYHLDHKTLPDGPSTYLTAERPLIDHGEPTGQYSENFCESK